MNELYSLEILDAIAMVNKIENFGMSINIPNPEYQYFRFRKYPYNKPMFTYEELINNSICANILIQERIIPYMNDCIDIREY